MPRTGKPDKPRSVIFRNALPDLFEKAVTDRRQLREKQQAEAAAKQAAEAQAQAEAQVKAEAATVAKEPKPKPKPKKAKPAPAPAPHPEPEPKPEPAPGPTRNDRLRTRLTGLAGNMQRVRLSALQHAFRLSRPLAAYWPAIVIPLLLVGSQVTLAVQPVAGVYANAAVLATLLGLALWQDRLRQLCIVTALLPTATMVLLSLPDAPVFTRTAAFYGCLLVLGLTYRYLIDFSRPETEGFTEAAPAPHLRLGLRGYTRRLPTMIILGQLLGVLGWLILQDHYPFTGTIAPVVAASAVIFALTEEVVLRGLIQHQASRTVGLRAAAVMSAILSGVLAIGTGVTGWWMPVFGLVLGSVLAVTYARTPNILVTLAVNVSCKLTFLGLLSSIS